MVAVTQIHAFYTVKIMRFPFRVVADEIRFVKLVRTDRPRTVCFNIGFIHNVKAHLVCKRQQNRVGRIV